MATVPKKTNRLVQPSATNPVFQSGRGATPEAFGAGIGRALQSLGGSLAEVSNNLKSTSKSTKVADDKRAAKEADLEFTKIRQAILFGDGEVPGYLGSRGSDAIDAGSDTFDRLEAARDQIAGGLGSIEAQDLFNASSNSKLFTAGNTIGRHINEERFSANVDAAEGRIEAAKQISASEPGNPAVLTQTLATVASESIELGQLLGQTDVETFNLIVSQQSDLLKKTIMARSRTDAPGARDLFNDYKDAINGTVRTEIDKLLDSTEASAITAAERLASQAAKAKIAEQEDTWRTELVAAARGESSVEAIEQLALAEDISGAQFKSLKSFFEAEAVEVGDDDVFNTALIQTYIGNMTPALIIRLKAEGKIDQGMANTLINTWDQVDQRINPTEAQALKDIDKLVGGIRGPLAILSGDASRKVVNAINEFKDRLAEGKEDIQDIKDDVIRRWAPSQEDNPVTNIGSFPTPIFWKGRTIDRKEVLLQKLEDAARALFANRHTLSREIWIRELDLLDQYRSQIILMPKTREPE